MGTLIYHGVASVGNVLRPEQAMVAAVYSSMRAESATQRTGG